MSTKYKIVQTGTFKKDLKKAIKRGYDIKLLGDVVDALAAVARVLLQ